MTYLARLNALREQSNASLLLATADLARVTFSNELHHKYAHNAQLAQDLYHELLEFKERLTYARDLNQLEAQLHEELILSTVTNLANQKLRYLRPNDKYELRLQLKSIESEKYLYVEIKHEIESDDEFVPVKTDVGKFMKQVISLSICLTVAMLMGQKEIFLDEPLASGSATSLLLMQDIVNAYPLTYYIVDQKPEMYSNLKRREFHLDKLDDGYRGYTVLKECRDVSPEE